MSSSAPSPSHAPLHTPSVERYAISAAVLVAGILVQYVPIFPAFPFAWEAELFGAFITYGPGLLAFFALVGVQPLRNAFKRNVPGTLEGLRWYAIFGLLSLLLVLVLAALYAAFDPNYAHLIQNSTGVDQEGQSNPILWMVLSFPIGLIEETLFRGFLFGGALVVFGTRRWKLHALWTSLLFAGVHLYYAQTYLEISPLFYVQIFLLGLAFCFAYFRSGGNLLVIALLHGAFDATSFAAYLPGVGVDGAAGLHYGLLLVAAIVALVLYLRESGGSAPVAEPPTTLSPPSAAPAFSVGSAALNPPVAGAPNSPLPFPPPVAWALASPESTPAAIPLAAPTATPTATPTPTPLPAAGAGASSGGKLFPLSIPPAGFIPPLCRSCGAIVMGDLHGLPDVCPRCFSSLHAPLTLTSPAVPLAGSVSHPVVHAMERPSPSPTSPSPPTKDPNENLPVGSWPPSPDGATPAPYHSAATLYTHTPEEPGSKGKPGP